jgi:hypothetical protein
MQSTRRDSAVHPIVADAESQQLLASDDAVLTRRELGDGLVRLSNGTLTADIAVDVPLDRHTAIVAARATPITTESHQLRTETLAKALIPSMRL